MLGARVGLCSRWRTADECRMQGVWGFWVRLSSMCVVCFSCVCVCACREDEEGFLGMSSHATLEVLPSRDIKVRHSTAHGVVCLLEAAQSWGAAKPAGRRSQMLAWVSAC